MIYLKIKENTNQAKLMIEYLKTLPFVEVVNKEKIPNDVTLKAMNDAENGKTTRAKNVGDLIKKLNK